MLWNRPVALLLAAVMALTVPPAPDTNSGQPDPPAATEGSASATDTTPEQSTSPTNPDKTEETDQTNPSVAEDSSAPNGSEQEQSQAAEDSSPSTAQTGDKDTAATSSGQDSSQAESGAGIEPAQPGETSLLEEGVPTAPPDDGAASTNAPDPMVETDVPIQPEQAQGGAMTVQLPTDLSFIIDPYEMAGQGQVYSDLYTVKNNGIEPVMVTIQDLHCVLTEDSGIELLTSPEEAASAILEETEKKLLLLMFRRAERPQQESFVLTEESVAPFTFLLEPDETAQFSLSGAVSLNPTLPWCTGEVRIYALFSVEPIPTASLLLNLEQDGKSDTSPIEYDEADMELDDTEKTENETNAEPGTEKETRTTSSTRSAESSTTESVN